MAPPARDERARGRLAWRPDPPARRDRRDQLGLRIGWVRFWLRGVAVGFAFWLMAVALGFWPGLGPLVPPFFYAGLVLMPLCAVLALLTWLAPLPFEIEARCPACGGAERILKLPWPFEFICRRCGRRGILTEGSITLAAVPGIGSDRR